MEEPKIEDVLRNIYDLYQNPDVTTKEKASTWLDKFQKSVSDLKFNAQIIKKTFSFKDLFVESRRRAFAAEK